MDMLTFNGAEADHPAVREWFADRETPLGLIAAHWFSLIRQLGHDVSELVHDGYPTACIGAYPFAYVGLFKAHVNVGFFYGAGLTDPSTLLEGTGKRMRHVKIRENKTVDEAALEALIAEAYRDIHQRLS